MFQRKKKHGRTEKEKIRIKWILTFDSIDVSAPTYHRLISTCNLWKTDLNITDDSAATYYIFTIASGLKKPSFWPNDHGILKVYLHTGFHPD